MGFMGYEKHDVLFGIDPKEEENGLSSRIGLDWIGL